MQQAHMSLFLLGIPAVLCVVLLIMVLFIQKTNRLLARQLTEITVSLELTRKQLGELQARQAESKVFQNNLQAAELTTKLQKPRLDTQHNAAAGTPPGKYSNIQALTDQGMSVEEIAAILAVSTYEAQQLVTLSRIARGNFTGNITG
ncbi:hypothetical protein [Desulfocastanea catecholica]